MSWEQFNQISASFFFFVFEDGFTEDVHSCSLYISVTITICLM